MASYKSILYIYLLLISFFNVVISLYEDQIGKFDWKQSFIGNVNHASFDSVKRVVVATEENVLASLYLKNGQIVWRHVLEDANSSQIKLLKVLDREVTTVSGDGLTWFVRGWDINIGTLLWEWTLVTEKSTTNNYWIHSKDQIIHVLPVINSHLEVTIYDSRTGRNNGKTSKISTPWMSDLSKCVIAGVYWTCISSDNDSSGQLYYMDMSVNTTKVYVHKIESLIGKGNGKVKITPLQSSDPVLLVIRNEIGRLVELKGEMPTTYPHSLSSTAITSSSEGKTLSFELNYLTKEQKMVLRSIDLEDGSENVIDVDYDNDSSRRELNILSAVCRGTACRVCFKAVDNSVSLLQLPTGKILWTREEALSNVVATEFLELPVSDLDLSIEHEFDSSSGDIVGLLYRRLSNQFKQISLQFAGQQSTSKTNLVRDEFGLHKVIVIATKVGKLFALDSITGNVLWSQFFPNVKPFSEMDKETMLLFVQRTARYSPLSSQCSLVMREKLTGNGVIFTFDPISGKQLGEIQNLNYQIKQAMLLPFEDEEHLKGLLILSQNEEVQLYPSQTKDVLLNHLGSTFLYTLSAKQGQIRGLNLAHSNAERLVATPTWNVNFGQAEIVALAVRPSSERVHSQGRVLADRSVLYKYVNPNLLAVATLVDDPMHKHVLSIYLIDGITGLIVYSAVHKRANKPVHVVHSENWLVYSYYNERFRRVELASVELYEGSMQSNGTAFSSHAVSQLPYAESQAYIFPATPLVIQTTLTERGITNKHVLAALSNGAVTEIPWAFLEPRNAQALINPEEGYIPYIPELPIPAEATINYNHSLARIKGVQVVPARLESTCLVLVHGLDLYFTRVTPSKTFDLLKEDFDHWLIAVVLIGLTVASYVTKRLASRKALKQAWK